MAKRWLGVAMVMVLAAGVAAADGNEAADRLRKAASVLTAMAGGGDAVVPHDLLAQARAVAVFPGVTKAALIVGGRHGEGVVSARRADGVWSAPVFYEIGGGSFGLQVGGQVVDLVLLVMSQPGVDSMLKSEFTLGGDASLAAGPNSLHEGVGTDGRFKAEIFSYAKSSGLFAGVSFEGSHMAPEDDLIRRVHGPKADSRDVLLAGKYTPPAAAAGFLAALRSYAPPPKKR
jgi:lipid-binding SYLF domain-containing protein